MKTFRYLGIALVSLLLLAGSVTTNDAMFADRARLGAAGVIVTPLSNGSFIDDDCSDIVTDWTDDDTGEAVSSQVTNPLGGSKTTFKFDTNTSADTNDRAAISQDPGSLDAEGTRFVLSLSLYCDAIGTLANSDMFNINVNRSDMQLSIRWASDGLYIHDGAAWVEVGTDLVVQDSWQEWTFDVDVSGGAASANCDVYLGQVLQSNEDCSLDGSFTDGKVEIELFGFATDDRIAYMDWFKIGSGFE